MILNSRAEYSRCVIPRLVLDRSDDEEGERMEREELESKKRQIEEELSEWENIWFYARESKLREMKKKIKRIELKIAAKKREVGEEVDDKMKKRRRKLNYPVIGDEWGVQPSSQQDEQDERVQPSLAGTKIDGRMDTKVGDDLGNVEVGATPYINSATSPTNQMGNGCSERGAAPAPNVTRERRLRQPLIVELLSEAAHPEPSARMETQKMRGEVDSGNSERPDDDVLCEHGGSPGVDDEEPRMSAGVDNVDPVENNKGTNSKNDVSLDIVKGGRDETVLPSVVVREDDVCVYRRGFCQLHKAQGEKFVF